MHQRRWSDASAELWATGVPLSLSFLSSNISNSSSSKDPSSPDKMDQRERGTAAGAAIVQSFLLSLCLALFLAPLPRLPSLLTTPFSCAAAAAAAERAANSQLSGSCLIALQWPALLCCRRKECQRERERERGQSRGSGETRRRDEDESEQKAEAQAKRSKGRRAREARSEKMRDRVRQER